MTPWQQAFLDSRGGDDDSGPAASERGVAASGMLGSSHRAVVGRLGGNGHGPDRRVHLTSDRPIPVDAGTVTLEEWRAGLRPGDLPPDRGDVTDPFERARQSGWVQDGTGWLLVYSDSSGSLRSGPAHIEDRYAEGSVRCTECAGWVECDMAISAELFTRGLCHSCGFWSDRVADPGGIRAVWAGGAVHHFTVGPGNHGGFGGQPWRVRFTDGRTVDTNDLWHQGQVPARFAARLPVNATIEAVRG